MERRQGCLAGLLELFFISAIFDWLQNRFGFGRGCSCSGIGCGFILTLIFIGLVCATCTGTQWTRLFGG